MKKMGPTTVVYSQFDQPLIAPAGGGSVRGRWNEKIPESEAAGAADRIIQVTRPFFTNLLNQSVFLCTEQDIPLLSPFLSSNIGISNCWSYSNVSDTWTLKFWSAMQPMMVYKDSTT